MTLRKDHSNLTPGFTPDPDPGLFRALVDAWHKKDGSRPTAAGTRLRHSDAAKCARMLSLKAAGFDATDPMDEAGTWVTTLGTMIHDAWQLQVENAFDDDLTVRVEAEAKCQVDGLDASGHADLLIDYYDKPITDAADRKRLRREVLELKTTGGFAFKMAVGERGHPQGPRHTAIVQTALNAYALDADVIRVGVMALEAISKRAGARKDIFGTDRFIAQWTMERDEWEPVALREVKRLQRILELVDDGRLAPTAIPDPDIPALARIVEPTTGRWELHGDEGEVLDSGNTWNCQYCAMQQACMAIDDPGTPEIEDVKAKLDVEHDREPVAP